MQITCLVLYAQNEVFAGQRPPGIYWTELLLVCRLRLVGLASDSSSHIELLLPTLVLLSLL